MKVTVGFDPGKDGALCLLSDGPPAITTFPFVGLELDTRKLYHLIKHLTRALDDTLLVIEKVHSMPGQGVSSMFTFGSGFGELKALAKILGHPWTLVPPQTWKKHVLAGTDKSKDATVEWALRTYPALKNQLLKKSGKPHLGKVDALAIATYGHLYAKR